MAKKTELFDITLSKDGTRMVAKLQAKKLVVTAYDDTEIVLTQGDYLTVKSKEDVAKDAKFLLENDYIGQSIYDSKINYLEMVGDGFRARVEANAKS